MTTFYFFLRSQDIQFAQEVSSPHFGPIWCMRFSQCGQLLATAGKDTILQIWVLKTAYHYFKDMRNRYTSDAGANASPTNSYENVISDQMESEDKSYQVFTNTITLHIIFSDLPIFCIFTTPFL